MTEKRFELSKSDIKDFRIYDYGKEDAYFIGCDEHTGICLVSLLNQLNEENEQLKKENEWLKSIRFANDVLKENKELKSFIKELTSNDGKIWLMNGYVYKTDKILKGDVE